MNKVKIKQVDAFTTIPFGGNPAGVVTDASNISDEIKQNIAKEMNLSETAFVSESDVADFKVQFFTPGLEVDLCGHATIGTFHALLEEGKLNTNKNIFYQETKAGVLSVELKEIDNENIFMMEQNPPKFENLNSFRKELSQMIGIKEDRFLEYPIMKVNTGIWWLVFGLKSLDDLENISPDLNKIKEFSANNNLIGITPFCIEAIDKKCDYHLRAIAPYVGVTEDPVCGTGNACVSSYIVQHSILDKTDFIGEEGNFINRPGKVYVNIAKENNDITSVKIGGSAYTILSGEIVY